MSLNFQNISIIIVSFKSDLVLKRCLKSIDKNINVILVDNSNNLNFKKKLKELIKM